MCGEIAVVLVKERKRKWIGAELSLVLYGLTAVPEVCGFFLYDTTSEPLRPHSAHVLHNNYTFSFPVKSNNFNCISCVEQFRVRYTSIENQQWPTRRPRVPRWRICPRCSRTLKANWSISTKIAWRTLTRKRKSSCPPQKVYIQTISDFLFSSQALH